MKRIALSLALLAAPVMAAASPAECLLVVNGKTIVDGPCEFEALKQSSPEEPKGSFNIIAGGYFATVLLDGAKSASAYWNGSKGSNHAHDSLGEVTPNGACWQNDVSKICAWKKGERQASIVKIAPQAATQEEELSPKFSVSAPQMWREFNENELSASAKYADTVFEITGTVLSVKLGRPGLSRADIAYAELNSSPHGDHVRAYFDDSAMETARNLKRGQQIRFTCFFAAKLSMTIESMGCR